MRKWGTFPVPVHVPLNRVQEHCGGRTKGQKMKRTPPPLSQPGPLYIITTQRCPEVKEVSGQEVGEAGRTEEKKEPSSTSWVRGATGV